MKYIFLCDVIIVIFVEEFSFIQNKYRMNEWSYGGILIDARRINEKFTAVSFLVNISITPGQQQTSNEECHQILASKSFSNVFRNMKITRNKTNEVWVIENIITPLVTSHSLSFIQTQSFIHTVMSRMQIYFWQVLLALWPTYRKYGVVCYAQWRPWIPRRPMSRLTSHRWTASTLSD